MPSSTREHTEWLSLIDVAGPFLSMGVLQSVFNLGMLAPEHEVVRSLRLAHSEWEGAPTGELDRLWVSHVLHDVLGWKRDLIVTGQQVPQTLNVPAPDHSETLRPTLVLCNPATAVVNAGAPRIIVQTYPRTQLLERPVAGRRWSASPALRMQHQLLNTGVRLGIVTNGEQWMLVAAKAGQATTTAIWYATIWNEEPRTLNAWWSLLQSKQLFGVQPQDMLESLLDRSLNDAEEITSTLGAQVRTALELLVRDIDRVDQDRQRTLLRDMPPTMLYDAALTVMMRLVFLLCAEERDLMPGGDIYDRFYAISLMHGELRAIADRDDDAALEHRYDAWSRLLATFRLVHGGANHDRLHAIAYGGNLFDPDRFPFLEGRVELGQPLSAVEPLPIANRMVLHLLEALVTLRITIGRQTEQRRVSYKGLDVEQIGHVYEGLLDHTAVKAEAPVLPLRANKGAGVPEVPLSTLEAAEQRGGDALLDLLHDRTNRTKNALQNDLAAPPPDAREYNRLLVACNNDAALVARVLPFAKLLLRDYADRPIVVTPGSLYVTAGDDRRATGTHYTPKSLTEPIVKHTLDPLVYEGPAEGWPEAEWVLRTPEAILALTVCDMAMGSGAFLVQAARYLADRLVEAWAISAVSSMPAPDPRTVPLADPSLGAVAETLLATEPETRRTEALRLVCERCIYGVDKNPMAVEMAKLSLWLTTMAKDRPFTFLDHALRAGDSLLGLHHPDQLIVWSLKPKQDSPRNIFQLQIINALATARAKRNEITHLLSSTPAILAQKRRLLQQAQAAVEIAHLGADLLVGIELSTVSRNRESMRASLLLTYSELIDGYATAVRDRFTELGWQPHRESFVKLREQADRMLSDNRPFHWCLEFPEIFARPDGENGFTALLGNPPFMGGQKITGNLGTPYRDYIVEHLANGKTGSADLCAYFFLRAEHLLGTVGDAGLLATNTIAQGDTREVGLEQLVAAEIIISRANPSQPWPGIAVLEVAHVWLRRGPWVGPTILDHQPVAGITPFLAAPGNVVGTPYRLVANADKSFQGSIVLGMGFVLTPEEAHTLIGKDPRNRDVLFPYLNGEDLNSRSDQSPSRWVINFHDWPLERAETYSDCMAIVREKVKPDRDTNNRAIRRERWWQYAERAPALYTTIAGMERVLVTTRVSSHLFFHFHKTDIVFSDRCTVFTFDEWKYLALFQSNMHEPWARFYSSSLESRLNYSHSDCFETFPFPSSIDGLEDIGERYYAQRQGIMQARQEGLTKTYNRFHDPDEAGSSDIAELRRLHVAMDHAVALAYGWGDLDLDHGFHQTKQGLRYTISEVARREVLARLLQLNHEHHAAEVAAGLHDKNRPKDKGVRNAATRAAAARDAIADGNTAPQQSSWEPTTPEQETLPGLDGARPKQLRLGEQA